MSIRSATIPATPQSTYIFHLINRSALQRVHLLGLLLLCAQSIQSCTQKWLKLLRRALRIKTSKCSWLDSVFILIEGGDYNWYSSIEVVIMELQVGHFKTWCLMHEVFGVSVFDSNVWRGRYGWFKRIVIETLIVRRSESWSQNSFLHNWLTMLLIYFERSKIRLSDYWLVILFQHTEYFHGFLA